VRLRRKTVLGSQILDELLNVVLFGNGDNFATPKAADVVMVVRKYVAQLNFVFPADVNTLYNPEPFEQINGAVQAGAVDAALGALRQVVHCLRLFAPQQLTHKHAGSGDAAAVVLQDFLQ
jgi:hypothetical protein